jgi:hypothetical protein
MSIGNALKVTSQDDFPAFHHFSEIRLGVSRQTKKNAGHKDIREDKKLTDKKVVRDLLKYGHTSRTRKVPNLFACKPPTNLSG